MKSDAQDILALPSSRGAGRRLLLPALLLGVILAFSLIEGLFQITAVLKYGMPTYWQQIPSPPSKPVRLLGGQEEFSGMVKTFFLVVQTEDSRIYRQLEPRTKWTQTSQVPSSLGDNCPSDRFIAEDLGRPFSSSFQCIQAEYLFSDVLDFDYPHTHYYVLDQADGRLWEASETWAEETPQLMVLGTDQASQLLGSIWLWLPLAGLALAGLIYLIAVWRPIGGKWAAQSAGQLAQAQQMQFYRLAGAVLSLICIIMTICTSGDIAGLLLILALLTAWRWPLAGRAALLLALVRLAGFAAGLYTIGGAPWIELIINATLDKIPLALALSKIVKQSFLMLQTILVLLAVAAFLASRYFAHERASPAAVDDTPEHL